MATITLPKIPSKLVDTAYPPGEPRPSWLLNKRAKRKERPFPSPSKTLPCPKEARGRKRLNRKHRVDGYPSREELANVRDNSESAFLAKKLEDMRRLEEMNRQRYKQLKRAARAGNLAVTKDGVFESKPCNSCPAYTYHKVASLTEFQDPCPGSHMAQHNQKNKKGKRAHEEKITYDSFPVTPATSFVPSISTEMSDSTEMSFFSTETCCTSTTAESSEESSVDSEEQVEVVYSPAEHMANLVMLDMEEKALIEVLDEEIDAYSKKLQEWSDCQDEDVKVEQDVKEKLVSLNKRLHKLDQSGNILVTVLHSVDEESQKVMMEREALHIEQKIQEEERILQELLLQQQRELSGEDTASQTEIVESRLLQPTPPPAHLRPNTSYVRPGRRLRRANPDSIGRMGSSRTSTMPREPSSLTTHCLQSSTQISQQTPACQLSSKQVNTSHAPVTQEIASTSQADTSSTAPQMSPNTNESKSHLIACEKKKVQDELRDMLTLYSSMLQADTTNTQSGKTELLTMVQDFLQEAPAEPEISTDQVEPSRPSAVTNTAVSLASEPTVVLESQAEIKACPSEDTLTGNDSEDIVGSHANILACDNDSEAMPDHACERQAVEVIFNSMIDNDNAQDIEVVEGTAPDIALDRVESDSMQDAMDNTGIDVIQHTADALQGTADREIIQNQSEASQSSVRADLALDSTESETGHDSVDCEAIPDEAIQATLSDTQDTANSNDIDSDTIDAEVTPDPTGSSAVFNMVDSEVIQATAESDVLNTKATQATKVASENCTIQYTVNGEVVQDTVDHMVIDEDTADIEATQNMSVLLDTVDNTVADSQTLQENGDVVQDTIESETSTDGMAIQSTVTLEDTVSTKIVQNIINSEPIENTTNSQSFQDTETIQVTPDTEGTENDAVEDRVDSEIIQDITDKDVCQDTACGTQDTGTAGDNNSTYDGAVQHTTDNEIIQEMSCREAVQDTVVSSDAQDSANCKVTQDTVESEAPPDTGDSDVDQCTVHTKGDNNREIAQNTANTEVLDCTTENDASEDRVEDEQLTSDVDPIQETTKSDAVGINASSQVIQDSADKESDHDTADGAAVQNTHIEGTQEIDDNQDGVAGDIATQDTANDEIIHDNEQEMSCREAVQDTADSSDAKDSANSEVTRDTVENEAPPDTGDSDADQSTVHSESDKEEIAQNTANTEVIESTAVNEGSEDTIENEQLISDVDPIQETTESNSVDNRVNSQVTQDSADKINDQNTADGEVVQNTHIEGTQETDDNQDGVADDIVTQGTTNDEIIQDISCRETVQNSSDAQDSKITQDTDVPTDTGDSDVACTVHSEGDNRETSQNTANTEVIECAAVNEASEDTIDNEQLTSDVDPIQETTGDVVDNRVNSPVTQDSADKENSHDTADEVVVQNTHIEGTHETDGTQDGSAGDIATPDTTSALQDSKSVQETAENAIQNAADIEVLPETGESTAVGTTGSDTAQGGSIHEADQETVISEVTDNNQDTGDGEKTGSRGVITDDATQSRTIQTNSEVTQRDVPSTCSIQDLADNEVNQGASTCHNDESVQDSAECEAISHNTAQNTVNRENIEGTSDSVAVDEQNVVDNIAIQNPEDTQPAAVAEIIQQISNSVTTWNASVSKATLNTVEHQEIDNSEAIHDTGNSEAVQNAGKNEELQEVSDSEPIQSNTGNVSSEGNTDIETAQDTGSTVGPGVGDREATQATSDSDVIADTTDGDNDATQGRTAADVTENVQSSSSQNRDGATPTIKENNSAQNFASTRAFKKFSRAVMKSQSSSGGSQVSKFLLPKKGVTKSLQSLGLLKNKQFSRTQLQKTPELQQPCKTDKEGAEKDVKTPSTAGVHVPIIKAHSDTKPNSSTHKKTRRMSLL